MYQLRLATENDAEALAEIYKPFVEQTAISFEEHPPTATQMWKRVQEALVQHSWWVCTYNNKVIGYAYSGALRTRSAYRFTAEVSVYVDPAHHRKRIAKALYTLLHEIMTLQGFKVSYAGMTIPNPASKAFHEALGYHSMAIYENVGYKHGAWHSTQWFCKQLAVAEGNPEELITLNNLPTALVENAISNSAAIILHSEHSL